MIELNLLSPEKKKKVNDIIRFVFMKSILELCVVLISLMGIITLMSQKILEDRFNQIALQTTLITSEHTPVGQKIKSINTRIRQIEYIQRPYHPLSIPFQKMREQTPKGVQWKSISFQENGRVLLEGEANTRQELLEFRDALTKLPFVQQVEAPLSTIVSATHVRFTFTIILRPILSIAAPL